MSTRVVMAPDWREQVERAGDNFVEHKLNPIIANDMRRRCPVDTGRLLNSIRVDGKKIRVGGGTVDYVLDVEYGTPPHAIDPTTKKALFWPGAAHPVRHVQHPGSAPEPFIRPALYTKRG